MRYEEILELVKAVSDAGLSNFEYTEGNIRIAMSCPEHEVKTTPQVSVEEGNTKLEIPAQPKAEPAKEAVAATVQKEPMEKEESAAENVVKSPLVGTFYAAPAEDAEPYVKVGDTVTKGQTLAIVEAMKLMNEIESEFDGVIKEIYVKNGEMVEYGQPLFCIG
ncbi:MAG: acetyl-CoA carboxylase biotin carboxyl carrier protein [Eubacteriales bacterium]|nr:acetyl-CoA carboxylase biotin carboxyl carrier protein [Eubacteriales bacterium]